MPGQSMPKLLILRAHGWSTFDHATHGNQDIASGFGEGILVIDMQNDFCQMAGWRILAWTPPARTPSVPLKTLLPRAGVPVVWVVAILTC